MTKRPGVLPPKFAPMLASPLDGGFEQLRFPLLASPKLDGVRCFVHNGVAYSRNLKPIRNAHVQQKLRGIRTMLDGELIVGDFTGLEVFNRTQSGVMSMGGTPDFTFWVFDNAGLDAVFTDRFRAVTHYVRALGADHVQEVPHQLLESAAEALEYEERMLRAGFEGIMLRHCLGPYKFGRSTLREGWLLKVKRFQDAEAKVLSIEEAETNTNAAFRDELGRMKRRNTKDARAGKKMLGTLICEDLKTKQRVRVAPGVMTAGERLMFWEEPKRIIGRIITYRFFAYGVKEAPRFPRFHGFRQDLTR